MYLRHFSRRQPVQYFLTDLSMMHVPVSLHALSVFLSGTRLKNMFVENYQVNKYILSHVMKITCFVAKDEEENLKNALHL